MAVVGAQRTGGREPAPTMAVDLAKALIVGRDLDPLVTVEGATAGVEAGAHTRRGGPTLRTAV